MLYALKRQVKKPTLERLIGLSRQELVVSYYFVLIVLN
jgi:hypothetical protein